MNRQKVERPKILEPEMKRPKVNESEMNEHTANGAARRNSHLNRDEGDYRTMGNMQKGRCDSGSVKDLENRYRRPTNLYANFENTTKVRLTADDTKMKVLY